MACSRSSMENLLSGPVVDAWKFYTSIRDVQFDLAKL